MRAHAAVTVGHDAHVVRHRTAPPSSYLMRRTPSSIVPFSVAFHLCNQGPSQAAAVATCVPASWSCPGQIPLRRSTTTTLGAGSLNQFGASSTAPPESTPSSPTPVTTPPSLFLSMGVKRSTQLSAQVKRRTLQRRVYADENPYEDYFYDFPEE